MDPYTTSTRDWLEARFRATDAHGVYRAHQPIYGFRAGPIERGTIRRYAITLRALQALAHLDFGSLVDIGGAEGYKAAQVRNLFGARVTSCDLSAEACKRAEEIYSIPARSVDIHALPFKDEEFDVVLCSETLEHVAKIEEVTLELLRVARKAVVITVPHESPAIVERNIRDEIPHAHIHSLNTKSFDWLEEHGCEVHVAKLLSPFTIVPFAAVDALPIRRAGRLSVAARVYNSLCPVFRRVFGKRAAAGVLGLDGFLSALPFYGDMVVTICKKGHGRTVQPRRPVSFRQVVDFIVPFHVLEGGSSDSDSAQQVDPPS